MRKILFRAKPIETTGLEDRRGYVYGYYFRTLSPNCGDAYIRLYEYSSVGDVQIDESTLQECTGMSDLENRRIFEGDLYEIVMDGKKKRYLVKWYEGGFYFTAHGEYFPIGEILDMELPMRYVGILNQENNE